MRPVVLCLAAALLGIAIPAGAAQAPAARTVTVPIAGRVRVWTSAAPAAHVVLLISGEDGFSGPFTTMARHLAAAPQVVVVGLSFPMLRRNAAREGGCWFASSDLELISHAVQRSLDLPQYHPPVLVGTDAGASIVFAALAAAPPLTFAGAVSLGFCPTVRLPHEICAADDWTPDYDDRTHVDTLPPAPALARSWTLLHGTADRVCRLDDVRRFAASIPAAHVIEIDGAGHAIDRPAQWLPALDRTLQSLWTAPPPQPTVAHPRSATTRELEDRLQALNLPFEFRWPAHTAAVLVFYSGDGGWASLDESVAERLVAHDVAVVGISSLRYFWRRKPPAEVAADLRRVVDALGAGGRPVFAGGFSFGAEIVPVSLREWSAAERRALSGLVLISPGESASFEIDPLDWIRTPPVNPATRIAPAVRDAGLPAVVLCGAKDDDTPCPALEGTPHVRVVRLPGAHHLDDDYDAVADAVLAFVRAPGDASRP
jgi:type IV secretory pathway VirJ component